MTKFMVNNGEVNVLVSAQGFVFRGSLEIGAMENGMAVFIDPIHTCILDSEDIDSILISAWDEAEMEANKALDDFRHDWLLTTDENYRDRQLILDRIEMAIDYAMENSN